MIDLQIIKYIIEEKIMDSQLDSSLFHIDEAKNCFLLIREYKDRFSKVPTLDELYSYSEAKSPALSDWINRLKLIEVPVHISQVVEDFIRERRLEGVLAKKLPQNGSFEAVTNFHREIGKLILNRNEVERFSLTQDHYKVARQNVQTHATCFPSFNRIIGGGGFYSPQLALVMAGPKGFKTGFMINIASGFAKAGKNVLFIDLENGPGEILIRHVQHFAEATRDEVLDRKYVGEIGQLFDKVKKNGGDLRVVGLEGHKSTVQDVENEIILAKEDGFDVDFLVIDYIDLIDAPDVREVRNKINAVYHGIKTINKRHKVFTLTVTPATRESFKTGKFQMVGMSEDWRKAYNADSCFAWYESDVMEWTAEMTGFNIEAVFQRIGSPIREGMLMVDFTRQGVRELTSREREYVDACKKEG